MRVLFVYSFKKGLEGNVAPFVKEQKEAVESQGALCECFAVRGKGVVGYMKNYHALKNRIVTFGPDVIHAHYGLCGLLANLQRKVPVVTTYHGSDINDKRIRVLSKLAMRLSRWNIFVSRDTLGIVKPKECYSLLPCGVDMTELQLTEKREARIRMHLDGNKRYVLFAGAFDNPVKNVTLAKEVVALLPKEDVEMLELKDYSREEVMLLMCAADALLMTSLNEGSPQVIKEALACGCPIVSVDVGDVRDRVDGVSGCFVANTQEPEELRELLHNALLYEGRTQGREKLVVDGLDNKFVAEALIEIYKKTGIRHE